MKNSPFILHLSPYKAAGPGGRMRNSNPRAVIRRTNRRPSVIGLHQPETAVEFQFQSVVEGDLMVAAVAFDTPDVPPRIVRSHEFQDRLRNQPVGHDTPPAARHRSTRRGRRSRSSYRRPASPHSSGPRPSPSWRKPPRCRENTFSPTSSPHRAVRAS